MDSSDYEQIVSYNEDTEQEPLLRNMGEKNHGVSQDTLVDSGKSFKVLPQYLAAIFATLGAFSLGCALGWTSPADLPLKNQTADPWDDFGYTVTGLTDEEVSWVSSLMPLGGAVVAFPIGFSVDIIGRKMSMLVLVIPFLLSWGFIIKPTNYAMLLAGRFILGFAGGAFAVAAPMYTGEIAHKDVRGALGSYFQLMVTLGILFVYALGTGTIGLWIITLVCFIIPILFAVLFFFMPESPYYYITKGKTADAEKSLSFFRGKGYDITEEISEMEKSYKVSQEGSLKESLKSPAGMKAMGISLALMFFQQFSGVNAVIMYTTRIFQAAEVPIEPAIATLMVGIFQFVATFIATLIIDKLGRRILLLISASVMGLCCFLVALYFEIKTKENQSSISWLPILGLCLFIVVFSLGFGPIPWMILGELFPSRIKGFASSTASCFNWILAFIVTKFYSNIDEGLGEGRAFWIFMGVMIVGTAFVAFLVPETKGKSLNEIQEMLGGNHSRSSRKSSNSS